MEKLTDLPNIGPKLAGHLTKAGVETPEQLRQMGAEEAFLRIRAQADPTACLHELEALAGAVEGVRKSLLPPERKAELKNWFRGL
ncbi:MAG: TfoX/Sxy family protein [Oscillibacter sp.]|nr:TfoX/Sxy family protein [Oscillibacter sp.]